MNDIGTKVKKLYDGLPELTKTAVQITTASIATHLFFTSILITEGITVDNFSNVRSFADSAVIGSSLIAGMNDKKTAYLLATGIFLGSVGYEAKDYFDGYKTTAQNLLGMKLIVSSATAILGRLIKSYKYSRTSEI